MCCLPDEVEAKVLLSQLRVQPMRIYVYPAGLHGTDAVPRIEKTYTAEQSDQTVGLLFFRTYNEFYKISKHAEKLQKMLCSDVSVFRYIFLRHKNFVCHIPIRALRTWGIVTNYTRSDIRINAKCLTKQR